MKKKESYHHSLLLHVQQRFPNSTVEGELVVLNTVLFTERDEVLVPHITEVVPWELRPQMVHHLKLKTSVEPIQIRVAVNVQRCCALMPQKVIPTASVHCILLGLEALHRKVAQRNLYMKQSTHTVRDKPPCPGFVRILDPNQQLQHPEGVQRQHQGFDPSPSHIFSGDDKNPGLDVKVVPREHHDRDVQNVLVCHQMVGHLVIYKAGLVVQRLKPCKHSGIKHENGKVLNIRVAVNAVGDNVVAVVVAFPPLPRDSEEKNDKKGSIVVLVKTVVEDCVVS